MATALVEIVDADGVTGGAVAASPTLDSEALFERFIRYLDAKPKTVETYTRDLRQFFAYLALHGVTRPTRNDVLAYRRDLSLAHKPTTVQGYITAVRLFFNWTAQEGLYPNIAEKIKGARLDKSHKRDHLTVAQVKDVLATIDWSTETGARDYAMIALMVNCGLRTIGVARANIGDLRPLGNETALYVQGKGRDEKTEYVKVSHPVENAVYQYLKKRGASSPDMPLFASKSNNSNGKRLTTRTVSGIVKNALRKAGYDSTRLTAHSLRHSAITLALIAGKDITEVQQFARHSNINTTMIYNHSLEKAKNSCGEAIAKAIF